jgi:LPXTG-motif cell wall-anchored protein
MGLAGTAGSLAHSPYGIYVLLGIVALLIVGWYIRRKR